MGSRRSIGILLLATGVVLMNCPLAHAQSMIVHSRVMAILAGMSSHNTQGYLGVEFRDLNDEQVAALKLKDTHGVEITGMDHDGPACKGGLMVHDVILQMNGQAIENKDQFRRMLRDIPIGKQVNFLVSRDGQQRTVQIQTANREEVERQAWEKHYTVPEPSGTPSAFVSPGNKFLPSPRASVPKEPHSFLGTSMLISSSYTGAKLEVMGPQLAEFFGAQNAPGLLVRSVEPNSPASDAGLRAGDVVVRVNSLPVVSGNDWSKTIHENRGKPVNVVVLRDKKEQTLTLRPDSKKRSSCEPGDSFPGWFANPTSSTRQAIDELEPVLRAVAATMHRQFEQVRSTPQMTQMVDRLTAWSNSPELQRQMEVARHQIVAAAEATRMNMDPSELRGHMNALNRQMLSAMRLD
ncbi:MAG TPA: PDZ domain-containing protein [Edaphobacter sp.]|nr:PDZ domain-containing protein [Edaphobacter sp.]